ncbi:hypothetical protein BURPS1106B_A4013 [Burkholderia pseudomallei 1106b]|uniref:Uncharacterized protein n=2 Tax=Burkholderia pseudomallei TaxID=28450 RepID=A3NRN6_BURP0|nr:hypothetical protein BURPS1106A_0725 [Burkholderia pseudomallei 1106a]AFR14599.1 hypothetical protein BPC006_I0711 [Burkholderia pseudomallei BPC006]EES26174.1 hypothetical protein BURPS1106B_A4013 [Burkholderia pseudomallei 1106b]VUD43180.1 unnamed protein product [Burkholderia pseudomallei]
MTTGAIDAHGFAAHRPTGSVRRVAAPRNPACANARARVLPPVSRKACDGAGLERRSRESACAPPRDPWAIRPRPARAACREQPRFRQRARPPTARRHEPPGPRDPPPPAPRSPKSYNGKLSRRHLPVRGAHRAAGGAPIRPLTTL